MALPFFIQKRETPETLRRKAEILLARAADFPSKSGGRFSSGDNRLKRAGREGDFRQFRNYNDHDRPQDIDWKRSGRSDDILVREREKNQRRIFDIHIQNDNGMHFHSIPAIPTKYEAAGIFALGLALYARGNHESVLYNSESVNTDEMAHIILDAKTRDHFQTKRNAITILIGDFTDRIENLEKIFSSIAARHVLLLQILDPAELELPYAGRVIFENTATQATVNNVDALRSEYKAALQSHLDDIKAYAAKKQWHYDLMRSDRDFLAYFNRALKVIGDLS